MVRTLVWSLSLILSDFSLLLRVNGAAMQYIDNSSERGDSFFQYSTLEERWAEAAYRYISKLDCGDSLDAFFTTKRECKELVTIQRHRMNVYVASPSIFGYKYKTFLPDEPLSRSDSHDAVVVVDPYPLANFGHLVLVFYVDNNVSPNECYQQEGLNLVPGDHPHQVLPAAMKLAFRYHIQTMCRTMQCVDSLVLYMNSPTKTDGTSLLWDVNGDGMAEDDEQYTVEELQSDLAFCEARKVHLVIDQSYAGEIAQAFKNSHAHKNVIVFASGKDHEYAFNDDYTIHWVQANHKRDCSRQVHEHSTNEIKNSSPVMREGNQGAVKATIFGAPCDVTPEFTDQELRENYLGCQNLPTAEWLKALSSKGD